MMDLNIPEILAELTAVFDDYERALGENDVTTLDTLFLDAPQTIRYGISENLYGFEEIAAFRASRPSAGLTRSIERTVITTYGRDFGIASTLFRRAAHPGKIGRQMQTWIRTPDGWRVAAAHVSVIDDKAP